MQHEIFNRLALVRQRLRQQSILVALGPSLLIGSALAAALAFLKLALPFVAAAIVAALPLLIAPTLGAWIAARRKPEWAVAAAAVDRHYGLHDRTLTALRFLGKADPKPMEAMQIQDAQAHLGRVDPKAVVPLRVPRYVVAGAILFLIAVVLIAWPFDQPSSSAISQPDTVTDGPPSEEASGGEPQPKQALDLPWRVAPAGTVAANRTNLITGATLGELVAGSGDRPPRREASESARPPAPDEKVLEPEPLPPEHRQTIRRYFQLIRPQDEAF
jgi:hypothetical protein